MNYTTNYHLPQWVETDRILRTDFNDMASAIDVLRLFCDPRYHPHQYDRMSQEVAINLYRTAHGSLVAAYNALEAAHRLQHAVLSSVERS